MILHRVPFQIGTARYLVAILPSGHVAIRRFHVDLQAWRFVANPSPLTRQWAAVALIADALGFPTQLY